MDATRVQHNKGVVASEQMLDDTNFEVLIDSRLESNYLEMLRKLKSELSAKSSENEVLKIKLEQSSRDLGTMTRDLNECKLTMFQNCQDAQKAQEEMMRSKKLEEDYVRLMGNYLNLSEQYQHSKQEVYDNYIAKTNAINNYECLMSNEKLCIEIESCRENLDNKSAELSLVLAKLRNMEEENGIKEKCLTELRRSLDDAKVTHKHEIKVLEEYIQCLKNTITSYERTLTDLMDEQSSTSRADDDDEKGTPNE